jgi:hypothetical protein
MSDLRSFTVHVDGHLKAPKLAPSPLSAVALAVEELPREERLVILGGFVLGDRAVIRTKRHTVEARLMQIREVAL